MDPKQSGKRFSRRVYYPRIVGTILCTPIILESIIRNEQPTCVFIFLALNVLVWPHIAYQISMRAENPYHSEMRNLSLDSFFCGLWIAVVGLNVFGSISMSAMVVLNTVCTGGLKFMRRGIVLQAVGFFLCSMIFGITLHDNSIFSAWVSLPLLAIYPIFVGFASYMLAAELKKTKITLRNLSITDSLTGLFNRRHFDSALSKFSKDCLDVRNSLLLLIDIDNFKKINDSYGHDVGDEVICLLAKVLKISLRPNDNIARFGGDEFCVIMLGTSLEHAEKIVKRIRETFKVKSYEFLNERLSISVGIAIWDDQVESADEWFVRADKLLYKAKQSGRDRTEVTL